MMDSKVQDLVKDQATKAVEMVGDVKITSQAKMDSAIELLVKVRKAEKYITDKKLEMTAPVSEGLKKIRAFFKPYEIQITNAKNSLNRKITDYQYLLEKKEEEKIAKIEKEVEEEKIDFTKAEEKIEKVTVDKKYETTEGKLTFKTIREVVLEDESKLPRKYLVPDMVKIRREALMGVPITGVKVVEKKVPNVRC